MTGATATKLVDRGTLREHVRAWRRAGEKVVVAEGVFDLLTVGHVRALAAARARGDRLVVAVAGDTLAAAAGPDRPFVGERDRALLVASLRVVDRVTIVAAQASAAWIAGLGEGTGPEGEVVGVACVAEDRGIEALIARVRARHAEA